MDDNRAYVTLVGIPPPDICQAKPLTAMVRNFFSCMLLCMPLSNCWKHTFTSSNRYYNNKILMDIISRKLIIVAHISESFV